MSDAVLITTADPAVVDPADAVVVDAMKAANIPSEQAVTAFRKSVLNGHGFLLPHAIDAWKIPSWQLLVFVSSTFTDSHCERDFLMKELLPVLKNRARSIGVTVAFSDMRWGVRDENTLDHRTWIECERELRRCFRESMGLYFLSLQSEKFGYTPLPRVIDRAPFDERMGQLALTDELRELVDRWYILDENSISPVYALKQLESIGDSEYWNKVLPEVSVLVEGLPSDSNYPFLTCGQSVTEWEVRTALHLQANDFSRFYWLERIFRVTRIPACCMMMRLVRNNQSLGH